MILYSTAVLFGGYDKITILYKGRDIKSELITVIGKITDSVDLMVSA